MAKILISYRRSDSDVFAGRVRDRLAQRYGEGSVFMDVEDIPFGRDFRQHIKDALRESNLVIVIIGQRWLGSVKNAGTPHPGRH
jgi:TIR domain